jgi:predicted transcriptional regulator
MLGIRLSVEAESRLERHAREAGRPKSVIARDWIMQRLEREEVDELIRCAAHLHASMDEIELAGADEAAAHLGRLDAEDGGYDWGQSGPPEVR